MPRTWTDTIVEKPRTFNIQNNPDGTITLIPAPGNIIQAGTPVNAANLNGIEQDILSHQADNVQQFNEVNNEIKNKTVGSIIYAYKNLGGAL